MAPAGLNQSHAGWTPSHIRTWSAGRGEKQDLRGLPVTVTLYALCSCPGVAVSKAAGVL